MVNRIVTLAVAVLVVLAITTGKSARVDADSAQKRPVSGFALCSANAGLFLLVSVGHDQVFQLTNFVFQSDIASTKAILYNGSGTSSPKTEVETVVPGQKTVETTFTPGIVFSGDVFGQCSANNGAITVSGFLVSQ